MDKIFDWKGNEVKAGMTIYFVRTTPIFNGKLGLFIPKPKGRYNQIWETDEAYSERMNQEIWELGREYELIKNDIGEWKLLLKSGEYTFEIPFEPHPIIAIKGVSDKK